MKKYLFILLASAAMLASCGEEILEPKTEDEATPIVFNLTANHPDATKAVKSGWENGDAIFVFFDKVAAPKHLKMSYNGSTWTSAEYDGATATPGALGLKNDDTGTMRAVFLPFGSELTVSAGTNNSFVFSQTQYTYYLTATLTYEVVDNKVRGAFDMSIPDGYVQFFVEDAEAVDEAYLLGCDAVIPVGVASIAADGTITETSDKTAANDMPGYAYSGGYLFSGKLGSWGYGANYYFAKTKSDGTVRHDYFVRGKTLSSHSAVKLPAASDVYAVSFGSPNNGKWIPVGSGITVMLCKIIGEGPWAELSPIDEWYTCNYNCTKPEQVGTLFSASDFNFNNNITRPTEAQFLKIINPSNCSWTWLTIHGQQGAVVCAESGFLFLPAQDETQGIYWSSNPASSLSFKKGGEPSMLSTLGTRYPVRSIPN